MWIIFQNWHSRLNSCEYWFELKEAETVLSVSSTDDKCSNGVDLYEKKY